MKKQFKAESKRLLDLMINSIYTNKEIFLRELISNSSDAIDKVYLTMLQEGDKSWNSDAFKIRIKADRDERTITIEDNGIGMSKQELDENLGTIAKSGSLDLKESVDAEKLKDVDIIGQFGVGFYSGFMVADEVVVQTKKYREAQGHEWISTGVDGFTIQEFDKEDHGTKIILRLKENDENDNYDEYLFESHLEYLIKKYSNYIRYPVELYKKSKDDYGYEMVNSRVPIWKKSKDELSEEDYNQYFHDQYFGFGDPIRSIHFNAEGLLSYKSLMFIPSKLPMDYYMSDDDRGLSLYGSGVMIMEHCPELLPDYFNFVQGVVDSEDLSLNISREMLQQNRQLQLMSKRLETKIIEELKDMMENDPKVYEDFFSVFGKQLKLGIYQSFGMAKDKLEDLLIFPSSLEGNPMITLKAYMEEMKEDQEYIYYGAGASVNHVKRLPQTQRFAEKGYPVLFLTDEIDEFVIKVMNDYGGKVFKSISDEEVDLLNEEEKQALKQAREKYSLLFERAKDLLQGEVQDVVPTTKLNDDMACLSSKGELSIEMEKMLSHAPDGQQLKADKVLELNIEHPAFEKMDHALLNDTALFEKYIYIIYNQARLIEGLPIGDPVKFAREINSLL